MQTWERGAGLTMACGTGACASVVALNRLGLLDPEATVQLAAGELHIALMDDGRVIMTGPAAHVFDATLDRSGAMTAYRSAKRRSGAVRNICGERTYALYLVGGYVRNLTLGLPGGDFDVCSAARTA